MCVCVCCLGLLFGVLFVCRKKSLRLSLSPNSAVSGRTPEPCVRALSSCCLSSSCPPAVLWPRWRTLLFSSWCPPVLSLRTLSVSSSCSQNSFHAVFTLGPSPGPLFLPCPASCLATPLSLSPPCAGYECSDAAFKA